MTPKLQKLSGLILTAKRFYDSGHRRTALKVLTLAVSKVSTQEERKLLDSLVESQIRKSGIWVYYKSKLFGVRGNSSADH